MQPNTIPGQPDENSKKLNQALKDVKKSSDLWKTVFDNSLIGMSVLDAMYDEQGGIEDFLIIAVNKELERETGRKDLPGKVYTVEYPGIKQTGLFNTMLNVMNTGVPEGIEYYYGLQGADKWFSCMFVKTDEGLVATNLNITARKLAEEERLQTVASQNQRVFWATLNIQEIERKRIAESLHNGIGQMLYSVKMGFEQLKHQEKDLNPAALNDAKNNIIHLLDDTMKECRRISHELTPAILEDFGLKEALNDLCSQFNQSLELKCRFSGYHHINKNLEIAIYRIVQELIMNVVKHAEATRGFIKVDIEANTVGITVQDNGIGFNFAGKSHGIGLKTIQNKVRLLNGTYILTSKEREGSTVEITIPYDKNYD